MQRAVITLLLAVLSTCTSYAQSDVRTKVLDTKPGLDKKITMTVRAVSLREVLDKVEAETEVRLRPDREIAEDKCTIRVKETPARDLLRAIAKCFNLGWAEAEIGSLRYLNLYMDRESKRALDQKMYDDYKAVFGQFDEQMKTVADAVKAETRIRYDAEAIANLSTDERDRLRLRSMLAGSKQFGSLAVQFLHLSEVQKRALFEGQEVKIPKDGIAKGTSDVYPEATQFTYWVVRSLAGYLLQATVQPVMPENQWILISTALFDDRRYEKLIDDANAALLKDGSLAKELPDTKETPPAAPSITQPQASEIQEMRVLTVPRPGEGSGATPTTMSDALMVIADQMDIPLVAQYLSEYAPDNFQAPKGKVAERLASLAKTHKFMLEKDGDILFARAVLWHRLRDREVPESKIRQWQKEITGLPHPTFAVVVEMGCMGWSQIRGIINNGKYWFGTSELGVLAPCEYGLKLYGSLTAVQQKTLADGRPIPVASLRSEQQHLFMQAYERKARPTYAQAQEPTWAQTASITMEQPQLADGDVFAAADMRFLGSESLSRYVSMPDQSTDTWNVDHASEMRKMNEVVPKAAQELLDRMAREHPRIPRKHIGVYALYYLPINLTLKDKEQSGTAIFYCGRVL